MELAAKIYFTFLGIALVVALVSKALMGLDRRRKGLWYDVSNFGWFMTTVFIVGALIFLVFWLKSLR